MKDEYQELPAFTSNDFKVGDMVRVYGADYIFIGRIDMHVVEGQDMIHVQGKTEDSISDYFHFKQCRLLKRRERRVWWVMPSWITYETICSSRPPSPNSKGWVKVCEVFDGEE